MVYLKYCKKDKYMSDLKISVIVPIYKVEKMHECKINMANDLEVSKHASTIQNI